MPGAISATSRFDCGVVEIERCALCLVAPATCWGGWVSAGEHRLLAGWCRACRDRLDQATCSSLRNMARPWTIAEFLACELTGWSGHWVEAMGMLVRGSPSTIALRQARRAPRHRLGMPIPASTPRRGGAT